MGGGPSAGPLGTGSPPPSTPAPSHPSPQHGQLHITEEAGLQKAVSYRSYNGWEDG